jgi:carboxylate-amine ligase
MRFTPSPLPTVGIELELQLLDASSLDLVDGIMPLIRLFPDRVDVKAEMIQSCVEISSPVCEHTGVAEQHLRQTVAALKERCASLEMALCGSGTHPFARHLALITPAPRFMRMKSDFGITGRNQLTFATHVHVGVPSGDVAMSVMRRLTPCLPLLLAVAANSPYWRGQDTGFSSYRHCILAASQSYGLPPYFEDWQDFVRFLRMSEHAGIFSSFKDMHWDLRPHPDFGTLEVRVMDAASSVRDAAALAALCRALAVYLIERENTDLGAWPLGRLPRWIEQMNRYQASLKGLDARYIVDEDGDVRPIRQLIHELLSLVGPVAERINEAAGLASLRSMLDEGGAYGRQRRAREASRDFREVVRYLAEVLEEDTRDLVAES